MRLINADLLLKKYSTYCGEESCEKCKLITKERCNIYKTIYGMPTAFDVDNVVEMLEFAEHRTIDSIPFIDMNEAIAIVKGGLNEHGSCD